MTDINSLPITNNDDGNNSELVDKILSELQSNDPNPQYGGTGQENESELPDNEEEYDEEEYEEEEYEEDDEEYNNLNYCSESQYGGNNLYNELKTPIIIAIISFIINNVKIEEIILNIGFFNSENQLNIFGFIFKAILVGVSFYMVSKYVLPCINV